ncbi:MAG: LytTR family transcriptional regulator [Verrucomicrobia bacterium]|nr:LytTR family transcriptional regulator [Verrucomicrobiota bacterium]
MRTSNTLLESNVGEQSGSKLGPDPAATPPANRLSLRKQLAALVSGVGQTATEPQPMDCFVAKSKGRVIFIRSTEIDWIETANNYVKLHVGEETHLMRETMANVEAKLPADRFLRISRSAIVNLERMRELQRLPNNGYAVILTNGDQLNLSRGYRKRLRQVVRI